VGRKADGAGGWVLRIAVTAVVAGHDCAIRGCRKEVVDGMPVRCESSRMVVRSSHHSFHAGDDDTAMVAHFVVGDTDGITAGVGELQTHLVNLDGLLYAADEVESVNLDGLLIVADEAESVAVGRVACLTDDRLLSSSYAAVDLEGTECPFVVADVD